MKKRSKQFVAVMVLIGLIGLSFGHGRLLAEEPLEVVTVKHLTEQALRDNTIINDLNIKQAELEQNLHRLKTSAGSVDQVTKLLPRYNQLGQKYAKVKENDDYTIYIRLMTKAAKMQQEISQGLPPSDPLTVAEQVQLGSLTASLGIGTDPEVMTFAEYMEYQKYKEILYPFGISSDIIKQEDEYRIFVEPIAANQIRLEAGIEKLKRSKKVATESIRAGVILLYNSALMLDGYATLLSENAEIAAKDYKNAKARYGYGYISQVELDRQALQYQNAVLASDSMQRTLSNIKMRINVMRRIRPTIDFKLEKIAPMIDRELTVKDYIKSGLKHSVDIQNADTDLAAAEQELKLMKDYYSVNSNDYLIQLAEVEKQKLNRKQVETEVIIKIHNLYHLFEQKEAAYQLAQAKVEDAENKYRQVQASVNQGFATEGDLVSLHALVTSNISQAGQAGSDYYKALHDLFVIPKIGPLMEGTDNEKENN